MIYLFSRVIIWFFPVHRGNLFFVFFFFTAVMVDKLILIKDVSAVFAAEHAYII
jgi:hypothetical protein